MAEVKICGLTDIAGLDAALAGGAHFVGLVFFAKSPRHVSLDTARMLAARARGRAEIAAVTVDAGDDLLGEIRAAAAPDWIQAHGAEPPARLSAMRAYAGKGVIKALGVAGPEDLGAAASFAPAADMLLFDAKPPAGADRPGGNAAAFDWALLKGRSFARPWLLSGGLTPENVAEALALSGAGLADVSSGVESRPGVKDPARIGAFLAAALGA